MIVSTFITSFIRLLTTERYVSRALLTRSRKLSLTSCSRTSRPRVIGHEVVLP
jgi:hypothetical protein